MATIAALEPHPPAERVAYAPLPPLPPARRLRAGGDHGPLCVVGASEADASWFASWAGTLDPQVPVLAVDASREGLGESAVRTVEAMATRLLHALRGLQPAGPYRLLGRGLGGVLAHEMAVQLIGQDLDVEFLGVVDADCPAWPSGQGIGIGIANANANANANGIGHRETGDSRLEGIPRAIAHYAIQPMPLTVHAFGASAGWAQPAVPAEGIAAALARAHMHPASLPERQHNAHVVIQSGSRGQVPVLCVPGAGDSVIGFIALSEALGAPCPLHGLQPRGVEGQLVPHATVEAAAAFYLEATAALRGRDPVHLVGHSFGGWIVFEMALQLTARQLPVASVTIIDTEAPDGVGVLGSEYTSNAVLVELIRIMEMSAGQRLGIDVPAFEALPRQDQLQSLHAGMVRIGLLPRRSDPSALRGLTRAFGTALRTTYRPLRSYVGPVGLALARDPNEDDASNARQHAQALAGWKRWAPGLRAWNAPGDHFSVLKPPHVRALAQWWRAGLATPEALRSPQADASPVAP